MVNGHFFLPTKNGTVKIWFILCYFVHTDGTSVRFKDLTINNWASHPKKKKMYFMLGMLWGVRNEGKANFNLEFLNPLSTSGTCGF